MALTTAQLKELQDWYSNPAQAQQVFSKDGTYYQQDPNSGGYMTYGTGKGASTPGQSYSRFNNDGSNGAAGQFIDQDKGEGLWKAAFAAAMAGGIGFDSGMFGAAGGGAAGPGDAAWGMDLGGAGAADTSYLGNVGAAGGGGAAGPGQAGWGMDLGGAGAADTSYLGNVGGSSMGSAGAGGGAAGGVGGAGAGGSSLLSSLGGASSLLGPLATVAGAALGAQGNKNQASSTRTMDPRLDGPVFGENGLVPMTQGLLQQQMPRAQQAGQNMQNYGQGLLSRPIAGNGFELFKGRR
jgi:hypothetical protein